MSSLDLVFDGIQDQIDSLKKEVTTEIYAELIYATPQYLGVARKGWDVAINAEGIKQIPQNAYMDTRAPMYKVQYPEMLGMMPYIEPIPDGIEKSEKIVIGNKVTYINELNNGYSLQAEPFYIERTVLDVVNTFNSR